MISALGVLFGVLVLIAAAVAVARASYAKAQIEALRGDRDDLMKRVDLLQADLDIASEQLKAEREARLVLEKVVTGREVLEHIQSSLDQHVRDSHDWRTEQRDLALDILAIVGGSRRPEKSRSEGNT